jgi:hypothetical protein
MRRATTTEPGDDRSLMRRRRITLEDGRYLIFYAFDEKSARTSSAGADGDVRPEPKAEAEEERSV